MPSGMGHWDPLRDWGTEEGPTPLGGVRGFLSVEGTSKPDFSAAALGLYTSFFVMGWPVGC